MSEIKNNGAPTMKTIGAVGDIYTDISTGTQYKCTGSYNIGGQIDCEWKPLQKKDGEVKITPVIEEKPAEEAKEVVEPEVTSDAEPEPAEEVKEIAEEKPKNQNQNSNRNKSNNHPNNRTDYASKFKG